MYLHEKTVKRRVWKYGACHTSSFIIPPRRYSRALLEVCRGSPDFAMESGYPSRKFPESQYAGEIAHYGMMGVEVGFCPRDKVGVVVGVKVDV